MSEDGRMITCDYCKTKIFVKKYYGPLKDWWHSGDKDLCPECSTKYDGMIRKLFEVTFDLKDSNDPQ